QACDQNTPKGYTPKGKARVHSTKGFKIPQKAMRREGRPQCTAPKALNYPKCYAPKGKARVHSTKGFEIPQKATCQKGRSEHISVGWDTIELETAVSTISQDYLLEFMSEYGWMSFSKRPGKNTPQCYTKPLDSLKNWNNRYFWVDERVFPTIVDWRTSAPKDGMLAENTYSPEAMMILNTHRIPIQKQPEALLRFVRLSRRYFLRDEVYPTFLYDDDRGGDTIELETAVSTISQDYLLEFMSEYDISEALHLELPGPGERIVDFPEGKARPKLANFEINCRVFNIVPTLSLFRVFYIPSFHIGWMSFSKRPGKNTPQCYTKPLDSLKNWNNRYFWVDERVFPTIVAWRTSAPKDGMLAENTYSPEAMMILNTHRIPIQKQPEALLRLVRLSRRYFLRDEVYPTFLHDDDRDMDLFNLIRAPNPTKVKSGTRPRAAHEVPQLTVTTSRVIEMEDPAAATDSSGVPSTIERSHPDFANENPSQQSTGPEDQGQEAVAPEVPPPENATVMGVTPEVGQAEGVVATGPHVIKERRKRGNDGFDANAPAKVLRKDPTDSRPTQNTNGGKSIAAIWLETGSIRPVPTSRGVAVDVSDPDPLSFVDPQSRLTADVSQVGVTNGCLLNAPKAYQDLVDHIAPPRYFSEEAKPLKKSVDQVASRDKRIQDRENEIKNLETLLEAETDMKKAAEGKSAELIKELENLQAQFSDLQVSNNCLSQQVSALQAQRCAEMDTRLDALSIGFDEELYLHMLTAIIGHRWVIGHRLRLAVMKCGESTELRQAFTDVVSVGIAKGMCEGLKYGVEHRKANLSLEAIEAYDLEAEAKYIAALHALKDLKYPIVDQLESLKDAPMDVIMASLHLESDTGDDAP
nr:transposase (putative), gypsy type [Tanacetum cinerariifolium]